MENLLPSTIVEINIEGAVSIENIVMPCSRNKVGILSAKDAFLSRTFSRVCLILATCVCRCLGFCDSILALPVFRYLGRLIYLCITALAHQNKWDHFLLLVSLFIRLLISVNFDVLFKSPPCIPFKALSIPKDSCMSRSVFCDASRVNFCIRW